MSELDIFSTTAIRVDMELRVRADDEEGHTDTPLRGR